MVSEKASNVLSEENVYRKLQELLLDRCILNTKLYK